MVRRLISKILRLFLGQVINKMLSNFNCFLRLFHDASDDLKYSHMDHIFDASDDNVNVIFIICKVVRGLNDNLEAK